MGTFIDRYRNRYGVEPICAVQPTVPSTYYQRKARKAAPDLLPPRAKRDAQM